MGREIALHHRTEYRYDKAVALGPQSVQLRPAPHCRTPILSYALELRPARQIVHWHFDALANHVARVIFPEKTPEFVLDVNLVADLTPYNPFDFFLEPGYATFPFAYADELARDLQAYLALPGREVSSEPAGPLLRHLAASIPREPQPTVSLLVTLNQRVREKVTYTTRLEHGVQTCEQTLAAGSGSCRDSAWLLVRLCRELGFAARFVSGYLIQLAEDDLDAEDKSDAKDKPDVEDKSDVEDKPNAEHNPGAEPDANAQPATGPGAGPAADISDTADLHAWAEVYLPGAGWVGMDATSGLFTAEGHIPLACAPDPLQAAPLGGTVEPSGVEFSHAMTVTRLNEELRLTKPYSEAQWTAVRAVAHAVDRDLEAQDVRLTVGGEPTFVGIDEPESPQWNIEALGPLKRTRGLALIRSLRTRTAPGALLHLGQGKWYPGEALPRWAFHCISRLDGVPVWENGELFADENQQYGFEESQALRFIEALTRRLGAGTGNILPAFDPGYDTPEPPRPPTGYILPLRRRQPGGQLRWSSQLWFERPGSPERPAAPGNPTRLILSPGDSPIGYRIPVNVMPFVAPDELVYELEAGHEDHGADRDAEALTARIKLPAAPARHPELFAQEPAPDPLPATPANPEAATVLIRPALCVQVREGRLHVFLPFVPVLADYLDLVAAVEDTCAHLGQPVWVEGYTPPADPRVRSFSLTPDPGVLEVNLPPTADWDELESLNEMLAHEARRHRLLPAKFAYDGSHLATGGGSHITLGGPTVPESPLLRRPDLLRSMVSFWQNHPSLSYLFSGMYVGPTSQYPRVDEARVDALYELEVSFSQLLAHDCPPFILDGLFRNLLVDVTGNSHRAEFCIDKLYPPEGQGLRAGLLELRAFEMAPHVRMGLVNMLLVRALASLFWQQPFTGGLVRWGTALHDRYMLPHFVEADFREVLDHLRRFGYAFEDKWFTPHLQFRFPRIGSLTHEGVEVELRQALEPWNVLAEETSAGGTGRSVDSSLERMQVKVTGLAAASFHAAPGPVASRYIVTCNGRRVPLHPTGTPGEAVAGIRYRARKLSAALHPTIPVHTPLVFDLIDTGTHRAVGRCTYYAGPPDGRVHTARPADAEEARGRRLERFRVSAPPPEIVPAAIPEAVPEAPPEAVPLPAEDHNPVFPMTLDLRWPPPPGAPTSVSPGAPSRAPSQAPRQAPSQAPAQAPAGSR